ncbi:2-hydroxychromene-2-carboxylate isomerase [Variovorax sp. RHLX14]|uniref:2-hydroxychromene-2-carboxylate isomerase n=1 Tax=Variovorax sp. RHLX14 TaxID=1259731 RepID=UPI003F4768AD
MKHITFYLDFISPYAYLAFEQLPEALEGLSYSVCYKPILLGALLKQHGQTAPAETPAKRAWTYRHVLWLGHSLGIPLQMPASHPYSPLAHLRLAMSTTNDGEISRHVAETIFRDVWIGGAEATDPARLAALAARLTAVRDGNGDAARASLRENAAEAIALDTFGVPAFAVDGRVFWGLDSLPMLRAALQQDEWFDGVAWAEADKRPSILQAKG